MFFGFFGLIIASKAAYIEVGDVQYEIDEEANDAVALKLLNDKTDLIIPNEVEYNTQKYPVVNITDNFTSDVEIDGVLTLGENVEFIGSHSFEFQKISSFKMGSNVKEILPHAFSCCFELAGIIRLSPSLEKIDDYAFSFCSKITYILNSENVVEVGKGAFSSCRSLTTINLPSMKIAHDRCLEYCSSLISLELRDIEEACDYSLSGCSSLERLTVASGNLDYLKLVGMFCFANCVKLYELPGTNDVQYCENCFYNCIGFNRDFQIISSSVTGSIFYGCTSVNELTFYDVKDFGVDVIKNCPNCFNISFRSLSTYPLYNITIHDNAFRDCTQIKYINIADSNIVSIGNYAFAGCSGLSNDLVLPKNLQYLGAHAFEGCSSLTGLSISQCTEIENISDYTFCRCTNIQGILQLPKQIRSIGENAFSFSSLSGNIDIPENVESIGDSAFYMCKSFAGTVKIGKNVKRIGNFAFAGCSAIEGHLNINSNILDHIGQYAFYGCTQLSGQLKLPNSITYIGDYAFTNCKLFTNTLELPSNLKYIGESAFAKCEGFTGDLVIPKSIETIGDRAFFQCRGFETIEFNGDNISIGSKAFGSLHISCMKNVPSNCKNKNNEDCYDTDNFEDMAQYLHNLLGENCNALKGVNWTIIVLTTLVSLGVISFGSNLFIEWFMNRKTWKKRMTLIYNDLIHKVKDNSQPNEENSSVNELIELINQRTLLESQEEGFNLKKKVLLGILRSCLENEWPTLTFSNHNKILDQSFANLSIDDKNDSDEHELNDLGRKSITNTELI